MQSVLDRLLRKYRAGHLFQRTNEAFANLRSNSEEWEDELEEMAVWDQALTQGALTPVPRTEYRGAWYPGMY